MPSTRPSLGNEQAPDGRETIPKRGSLFSCLTRKALGEAMAPQRNSGENSGPQNISYTASWRLHQDISPERPLSKHMERCSASLTIREIQIKTTGYTMVYTLTARLSKTKQTKTDLSPEQNRKRKVLVKT